MKRFETEAKALRLEKKTLTNEVADLKKALTSEREQRLNVERNASSSASRVALERDDLQKEVAGLRARELACKRELKRHDAENDKLRLKLKKFIDTTEKVRRDATVAARSETTTMIGDPRSTPPKFDCDLVLNVFRC